MTMKRIQTDIRYSMACLLRRKNYMVILVMLANLSFIADNAVAQSMCTLDPNSSAFQNLNLSSSLSLYATVDDPSCILLQPGDYSATYTWSSTDGSIVNLSSTSGTTTDVTFKKAGSATIFLEMAVYSSDGSQHFETYTYSLNASVLPPVSIVANNTSCTDGSQNFSTNHNSYSNVTYLWTFRNLSNDNTTTYTTASPAHTFSDYGDYDVSVTSTINGYSSTDNITFLYEDFDVDLGDNVSLNFYENVTLDATNSFGTDYVWKKDGVQVSTSPQYTITEGGNYEVSVSSTACQKTVTDQITVTKESFNLSIVSDNQSTCTSATQSFTTNFPSLPGTIAYSWGFSDPGSPGNTSSLASPSHTFSAYGYYGVSVTVTYNNHTFTANKTFLNRKFEVDLGEDVFKLSSQSLTLETGILDAQYLWQDGSTNATYDVIESGTYTVDVTKYGCTKTDDITVTNAEVQKNYGICHLALNDPALQNLKPGTAVSFWATPDDPDCISHANYDYAVDYDWSVSNSSLVSIQEDLGFFNILFKEGGNYNVNLTMTVTNTNTSHQQTYDFSRNVSVLFPVSIEANNTSCTLGAQNFSSSYHVYDNIYDDWDGTFDNKVTYVWDFGDPDSGTNNTSDRESPSHVFSQYGDFNISVTTTLNDYETTDNMVFRYEEFKVDLGDDIHLDFDESVTLDATVPNGLTYTWRKSGTLVSTAPQYTISTAGTYEVSVQSDICDQTVTDQIVITKETLTITSGSQGTCNSSEQSFTTNVASIAGITSYTWDFDDPGSPDNSSSLANPSHTFSRLGYFTVSVIIIYNGTEFTASQTFLNRKFEVYLGEDAIKLPDETLILETGIAEATYAWQDGSTGPTYAVINTGTYTVDVTKFGCVVSDEITITVPSFYISPRKFCVYDDAGVTVTAKGVDYDAEVSWQYYDDRQSIWKDIGESSIYTDQEELLSYSMRNAGFQQMNTKRFRFWQDSHGIRNYSNEAVVTFMEGVICEE